MTKTLLNTQEALVKAAKRWKSGFDKNNNKLDQGPFVDVNGKSVINYKIIAENILKNNEITNIDKRIMIRAGLHWQEYKLDELNEQTKNLLGENDKA